MSGPTGPVTLGDLIREDKLLWVYCCDCYHERDVNPATVPLPPETPVPEVGKRLGDRLLAQPLAHIVQEAVRIELLADEDDHLEWELTRHLYPSDQ